MQSSYASGQPIEGSWHTPNRIVSFRRPIQRHNHVIRR
jgi:hypothetical protein